MGFPSLSNVYLFKDIVDFVPSSLIISPIGIQTNWLPAVIPDVESSITIPLSTVVALFVVLSDIILNPAGITILFPFLSFNNVFSVEFNTLFATFFIGSFFSSMFP